MFLVGEGVGAFDYMRSLSEGGRHVALANLQMRIDIGRAAVFGMHQRGRPVSAPLPDRVTHRGAPTQR